MPNLKTLLADLQSQLQEALSHPPRSATSAARLQAERVTLSLKLALEPSAKTKDESESARFELLPLPSAASFKGSKIPPTEHTLTIEFRVDPTGTVIPSAAASLAIEPSPLPSPALPAAAAPVEIGPDDEAMAVLTGALGAPGFDSSARATVFCEAMADLDEVQRIAVWECLGDTRPGTVIDPALKRARHLLRGILRSGPGGTKPTGPAALAALFAKHPSHDLLNLIRREWKTQADWL
ncbi:MAG: hypothetical protein JNN07_23765 [Verrucomicrobiales bacterium]|nr:hypothetical protein [Verrucomicrobiales bacterium]